MPMEIQFSDHGRGVMLRAIGAVSAAEYVNAVLTFMHGNRERLSTVRYWYSDHTEAHGLDLTTDDVQRLADVSLQLSRVNDVLSVAVCSPQRLHFGLSRMWTTFVERTGWKTNVFHTQSEAKGWLCKTVAEDLTFK
jgi:hypothetical protein